MDYRKQARELANLLGRTSVDYHNKSIAIDFIETKLKDVAEQVKKMNYIPCCKSDSEQLCDCKKHSIKTNYGFEVCTKCGNEFDN
jgi:hypothetical protein